MSRTKNFLTAYRLATLPIRWWSSARLRRTGHVPVTGIFLHRVADNDLNDWSMSISQFDQMLDWLEAHVDLVSMDEAQERLRRGNQGRLAVNISFDDGYADNCLHAIPTLLSRKIPFTYYVTTQNISSGKPFPHDLKLGQPLSPNSIDEISALSDSGIEIGVHTRTHCDIGTLRHISELEYEIRGAREDIAKWTGVEPKHFAFPFGLRPNITPRSIQFLFDEGFSSYCSAYGGYNFPFDGAFHIKRFHADPILSRIQNWLSFDPRWVYASPDYEYIPFQRGTRTDKLKKTPRNNKPQKK